MIMKLELKAFFLVHFQDGLSVSATTLGRISSYYYLNHLTLRMFSERLHADCSLPELIQILAVSESLFMKKKAFFYEFWQGAVHDPGKFSS